MAPNSEKICEGVAESSATPIETQPTEAEPQSEKTKATRHPRWSRQETLVLIEAKKLVENGEHVYRYRKSSGFIQTNPKWDMVSSFCQENGVKRGAVQCRKRWGNLLTDFRKIKKWESNIKEEGDSFWMMRSDVRKENKLPGFFDAVVYNVLDDEVYTAATFPLTLVKMAPREQNDDQVEGVVLEQCKEGEEEEEEEDETIVDSEKLGWSTEEDNIDTNTNGIKVNGPLKISTPKTTGISGSGKTPITPPPLPGLGCQREPMFQEGLKRKQLASDNSKDNADFNDDFIKVMRMSSDLLKAHLRTQNMNYQLAREQQKQQIESIVAALGKLTDTITKIANKM